MAFLKQSLATIRPGAGKTWDEMVLWVTLAYRATQHAVTGFSPAQLFLGRDMRLLIDFVHGRPKQWDKMEPMNWASRIQKN